MRSIFILKDEFPKNSLTEFCAEIKKLNNELKFNIEGCFDVSVNVEFPKEVRADLEERLCLKDFNPYTFILFKFCVNIDSRMHNFFEGNTSKPAIVSLENIVYVIEDTISDLFYDFMFKLIMCSVVAKPGGICCGTVTLYINDIFIKDFPGFHVEFAGIHKKSKDLDWPHLCRLPIQKVWDWAEKIPGFLESKSETSLGRAMAAFSYLFSSLYESDAKLGIFWAVMALEAIYCNSNTGLKEQLFSKAETILGKIEKDKKIITSIYDYRSKIIHGRYDFSYQHSADFRDQEKEGKDYYDSYEIAVAMLIGTFQYMVEHDIYELNFKYALTNKGANI